VVAPEDFDLGAELAQVASSAADLQLPAGQLFDRLQLWLQARNRGALALELEWTLDLKRLNGVQLPPRQQLLLRTAQATQDTAHLRKLLAEQLGRFTLAAPANHLRLRTLETVPWAAPSTSLLPEDDVQGERLHQLVERLSARLGEHNVLVPQLQADHRPEHKHQPPGRSPFELLPTWLLHEPVRLQVQGDRPCYEGPLTLLVGPQRLETAGWHGLEAGQGVQPRSSQPPVMRDYFIARSDKAGLLWVFRERLPSSAAAGQAAPGWFLHGIFA